MTPWPKHLPVVGSLGKFTWRMLAVVLAAQSILLFFGALVARGLAMADGEDGLTLLTVGLGLGILAIVAAGLMRSPLGLPLGWLVQLATWASAIIVPAMLGVGLVFTSLWIYSLVKGPRIEGMMAERERAAQPTQ
ncbi:MAG TPA: DUF4233 domain-containing protein [Phycicoccus sp.]|nr:DUF4233 domain-containing protein [Phycicoccus sp.]